MTDEKNTHSDDDRPEVVAPALDEQTPDPAASEPGGSAEPVIDGLDAGTPEPARDEPYDPYEVDDVVVVEGSTVEPVSTESESVESESGLRGPAAADAFEPQPHEAAGSEVPIGTNVAVDAPTTSDGSSSSTDGDAASAIPPQYGVGPLSIREVALAGVWALAFICSFFPIYGRFGAGVSVWGAGIDWVLTIGVPTVAVFLVLLRRFSPQGIRRVGSLGIDQFASVAFSVSATVWLGIIWSSFAGLAQTGVFLASWVAWVELILALGGVVLTVVAPHLPVLGEDFRHRPESTAHRLARPTRPVAARPQPARPVHSAHTAPAGHGAPAEAYTGYAAPAASAPADAAPADAAEPFDTGATTVIEPVAAPQAFWALAPEERDVLDASGAPLFRIGPTAWALVIEDRGEVFVVRHEDGRVGYLHETADVTRG
ncbi:hypothetical protein [Microbacterium sp. cf332]|uniref:hypothetical protein n=1 Tax=Microbacterium sp. cf332 TaxID=1761804 RepID=UPI00087E5475|nr:hypothetical protein [Microbacterium sp. cf332]SDQ18444.1 hypothetical protein SAMN04487847_0782 [Microbacterium sp. cf332]